MSDHIGPRVFKAWVTLAVAAGVWVWPFSSPKPHLVVSECRAQGCPDEESPAMLEQILESSETYLGCRILVQGTLHRIQGVDKIIYSIKLGSGRSLEVWPWAPDEGGRSPGREESEEDEQSMPSFVGRELRIEGRLVRDRSGRVVLEASIVEQFKGEAE